MAERSAKVAKANKHFEVMLNCKDVDIYKEKRWGNSGEEKNIVPEISIVTVIDTLELALFHFLIISVCEALRMLFST